jgi:hypothetical protein
MLRALPSFCSSPPPLSHTALYKQKRKTGKLKSLEESAVQSYHVSQVEMEDEKNQFHLTIDNVVYGPLQKIRIVPFVIDGEQVTFPLMTYFPLDLMS